MRDFLFTWFQLPITTLPKDLLVYHLLLVILFLAFLIFLAFYIKRILSEKIYFDFINVGEYAWRMNRSTGEVNGSPYCKKHQIRLAFTERTLIGGSNVFTYSCSICGKIIAKDIKLSDLRVIYRIAKDIADAKYFNYGKNIFHK